MHSSEGTVPPLECIIQAGELLMHSREANLINSREATVGSYFFFLLLCHGDALLCGSPQDPLQSGAKVHTGRPGGIPPGGAWTGGHEGTVLPPVIRSLLAGAAGFSVAVRKKEKISPSFYIFLVCIDYFSNDFSFSF